MDGANNCEEVAHQKSANQDYSTIVAGGCFDFQRVYSWRTILAYEVSILDRKGAASFPPGCSSGLHVATKVEGFYADIPVFRCPGSFV